MVCDLGIVLDRPIGSRLGSVSWIADEIESREVRTGSLKDRCCRCELIVCVYEKPVNATVASDAKAIAVTYPASDVLDASASTARQML